MDERLYADRAALRCLMQPPAVDVQGVGHAPRPLARLGEEMGQAAARRPAR
jgi:hypothetical protein